MRTVEDVTAGEGGDVSADRFPSAGLDRSRAVLKLHQAGRFAEADALCQRVLAIEPGNFAALYLLGLSALRTQRPELAVERMEKAVLADPRQAVGYNGLGIALNQVKRHPQALSCFGHALLLAPDFEAARRNREEAIADQRQWNLLHEYARAFGALPKLNPPTTFNERILHRILYDRDPRLRIICDKLAARRFIDERVGTGYAVPLLGVWERASDIVLADLPPAFVLKPSHLSGPFSFVSRPDPVSFDQLRAKADLWLRQHYFEVSLEWGYRGIAPRLLAEPLLTGSAGEFPPPEPQAFTFNGRVAFIRIVTGRKATPQRSDCWYDPTGRRVAIKREDPALDHPLADHVRRQVIALAEQLSEGFSSLRVDFYLTPDGLRVGELTPYGGAGHITWEPPELDHLLGRLWDTDFDPSMLPDYRASPAPG